MIWRWGGSRAKAAQPGHHRERPWWHPGDQRLIINRSRPGVGVTESRARGGVGAGCWVPTSVGFWKALLSYRKQKEPGLTVEQGGR